MESAKPDVFIVYQSNEEGLVLLLVELLELWGVTSFFCREEDRVAEANDDYRRDLADKLANCSVAIILLSKMFQWSAYCQAETGAIVTLKKERIPVLIPPVTNKTFSECAPVLGGGEFLLAEDDKFVPKLRSSLFKLMHRSKWEPALFQEKQETELSARIGEEVSKIKHSYFTNPPLRLLPVWPNIAQATDGVRVRVKEEIKKSLAKYFERDGFIYPSTITLVGVSLKYSLDLITEALQELLAPSETRVTRGRKDLYINVIHMDDKSCALRVVKDYVDIDKIINIFGNWNKIRTKWEKCCLELEVQLKCNIHAIDFVPPRVGILIDDVFLLEGSCAFDPVGIPQGHDEEEHVDNAQYRLLVGELEYMQYALGAQDAEEDARIRWRIKLFRSFFDLYKSGAHNGLIYANSPDEWESMLLRSVSLCKENDVITLISTTGGKYQKLLKQAATQSISVNIYLKDPGTDQSRSEIIRKLRGWKGSKEGILKVVFCTVAPYFRAVKLGDVAVALQYYDLKLDEDEVDNDREADLIGSEVRLFAAKHSPAYPSILQTIETFTAHSGLPEDSIYVIKSN